MRSNRPEGKTFQITALEEDRNKHARIEQGINVDAATPYILPSLGKPERPINLNVKVWYRELPAGLVATVGWHAPYGKPVFSYRIEFTDARGERTFLKSQRQQSIDIPLESINLGPYKVHIASEDAFGVRSGFVTKDFQVGADILYPASVEAFRLRVLETQAHLTWKKGAAHISHYHIRYLPSGSDGGWNEAVDINKDVFGRSATVPALIGTYLIKAVSIFGFYSKTASIVTSNTIALQNFNVVKAINAHPVFEGQKTDGLAVSNGNLELFSKTPISEWPSLSEVFSIGYYGGVPSSAEFVLKEIVDLGAVYTSRLTADLRGFGHRVTDTMANWPTLDKLESLAGASGDQWDLSLEMRMTDDDPNGDSTNWGEWEPFLIGDYSARAFQFRLMFFSYDPSVSIMVKVLSIKVDMPDRTENAADVHCPDAGIYVPFDPPFMERPTILINGQELPSGARSVRTNVTRSGFHQRFVDQSGKGIVCSFDYSATGFGRAY